MIRPRRRNPIVSMATRASIASNRAWPLHSSRRHLAAPPAGYASLLCLSANLHTGAIIVVGGFTVFCYAENHYRMLSTLLDHLMHGCSRLSASKIITIILVRREGMKWSYVTNVSSSVKKSWYAPSMYPTAATSNPTMMTVLLCCSTQNLSSNQQRPGILTCASSTTS